MTDIIDKNSIAENIHKIQTDNGVFNSIISFFAERIANIPLEGWAGIISAILLLWGIYKSRNAIQFVLTLLIIVVIIYIIAVFLGFRLIS